MLKDRNELDELLTRHFKKIIFDQQTCINIYAYCESQYNVPNGTTADIVSMRTSVSELDYFMLYVISEAVEHCTKARKMTTVYFTEAEIKMYKAMKFERDEIKFPLRFKMLPVGPDQWIGTITAKMIVKLCKAQLLAYNANTQRAMKMNIVHGQKVYRPALNMVAVRAIQEAMEKGIYISNTLTFNILNEDDFYYDDDTNELVIRSLQHFDITDGYHRYQALIRILNDNPDFNLNMELRITNFDEDKAKQFIYQEDQKTKMRKVDSDAMNNYNPGNRVVAKLNEARTSNYAGLITSTSDVMNYADMSAIVNSIFFKKVGKKEWTVMIPEVTKKIMAVLNDVSDYNTEWLQHSFNASEMLTIVILAKTHDDIDPVKLNTALKSDTIASLGYSASQAILKKYDKLIESAYMEGK